jgi:hypothetical protein
VRGVEMDDKPTIRRADVPSVTVIRPDPSRPAAYVQALGDEGYDLAEVSNAEQAAAEIPRTMPHVVVMSPAIPMNEHRLVHEAAMAVGCIVLLIADDAPPDRVCNEVDAAVSRSSKRRRQTKPPPP